MRTGADPSGCSGTTNTENSLLRYGCHRGGTANAVPEVAAIEYVTEIERRLAIDASHLTHDLRPDSRTWDRGGCQRWRRLHGSQFSKHAAALCTDEVLAWRRTVLRKRQNDQPADDAAFLWERRNDQAADDRAFPRKRLPSHPFLDG